MNEPTLNKSFEQRMFDQIKAQMGDLLTLEELQKILETAINKAFFSPRREGSGYQAKDKEPLFVELIRDELKPLIGAAAKQWTQDNQDKAQEILQKQLGDNAAQFVANAFTELMRAPMQQFSFDLQSRLGFQGIQI